MQMLQSDWLSYCTLSAISVQRLKDHLQDGDIFLFLQSFGGSLEMLLDNSISIRRFKEGNSLLHDFKASKLLNELMSMCTQLT